MSQHFTTEQWLPFPHELVFAFFANPQNLPPLMPRWQQARIDEVMLVPPPARPANSPAYPGVAAGNGTTLKITARSTPGLPFRLPWLARIEGFHWNERFCDVQVSGPFRYWRHCHSVHSTTRNGQDGTVVRDAVEYVLPLWPLSAPGVPLGAFAMRTLFRYRQRQAEDLLPRFAQRFQAK